MYMFQENICKLVIIPFLEKMYLVYLKEIKIVKSLGFYLPSLRETEFDRGIEKKILTQENYHLAEFRLPCVFKKLLITCINQTLSFSVGSYLPSPPFCLTVGC